MRRSMDRCNKHRQLQYLARTHSNSCETSLPRIGQNSKKTHEETKTEREINKDKGRKQNTREKPPTRKKKMHDVYIKIHNVSNTMHSDQTGRFPATLSSGNHYIMVLVEVNGNYIDAEPMKNRSAGSMIKAYLTLWK